MYWHPADAINEGSARAFAPTFFLCWHHTADEVPFVSGIDTPEIGSHAKCMKERKLALIAKGRLRELLAERGLRVMISGSVDKTPSHRPLVNICRTNGKEIGKKLLKEGFARTWSPKQRNDWCD
ncbi:thermonuclease family protein [Rhizobium leguminosarum]|uniref:thermonuclease family protein n=1 Tax=Rhizobium TaxID=379 RepID=UPI00140FE4BB|nr:thermonuclease family protein [Rhizobium leguminosarum]QIO64922.1 thermonuclease family protein [Rhizobium leguminosarum bv. trifolii]